MTGRASELVFKVAHVPGGWTVSCGDWTSALLSREQAMDLAEGMVSAVRQTGQAAAVSICPAADDAR